MGRTNQHSGVEELAFRMSDGLEVALIWNRADDQLSVVVDDSRSGYSFEVPARKDNALDVFYHPFAYAADEMLADDVLPAAA